MEWTEAFLYSVYKNTLVYDTLIIILVEYYNYVTLSMIMGCGQWRMCYIWQWIEYYNYYDLLCVCICES